ncbi:MAG TPA: hypothetical protein VHB72_02795 [Candidatus Saccharimonadales bacterium]|nr:hypothetical protein [Candidatus Saccharimonadales bacterium]
MNKRYLHHAWTKFRAVKPWYFLILAIVMTLVCVFALRANNEHMATLRQDVYTADKNDGNVEQALRNLQAYVTSHMNTNLSGPNAPYPPIQLTHTYNRLLQAQAKASAGNDQLYTEAQQYCEQQDPVDFSGHNRVPCIEQYVQAHGGGGSTTASIPDALYKFDFASPTWSPDLAGWSMVIAVLSWLLFIGVVIARRWFKHNV